MPSSIITAGDASNGLVVASGNDGAVTIQSGPAGAKVNALSIAANGAPTFVERATNAAGQPIGSIIQVVHTAKTNTFSGTSVLDNGGYFIDVTAFSASITPSRASNRILVTATLFIGATTAGSGYQQSYRLKRTIAGVAAFPILGDAEGGRPRSTGRINLYIPTTYTMAMLGGTHQDSPNTLLPITYQIQIGGYSGSPIVFLNRSEAFQFGANDYDTVPVSTLTLMEIAT